MAKKIRPFHYGFYFFERILVSLFIFISRILPLKFIYPLSEFIGTMISPFLFSHRRRVMGNLDLAFGSEKNRKEKLEIYRNFNINMVKNFLEMISSLHNRKQRELINSIQIVGKENLDASLQKGKGVIAVSAHLGNFTILGLKLMNNGYCFRNVVRGFTDPLRKHVYEKYRMKQGQSFIFTRTSNQALKNIIQALRNNEVVFIITDENKRHGGVFVNFFNRLASTNPGPAIIHLRTGAEMVPMFLIRKPDNTHMLIIEPPLNFNCQGNRQVCVKEITSLITQKIEDYIRKYPSQWMWNHRRWHTRPREEKDQGDNPIYRKY